MHLRSANCGFRAKSPKSHSSPINSFFATGCTASVRIRLALQSWPAMLLCMHSNRLGPQTVKVGYGRSKLAWLQTFLELPNGIPSHDTFRRVFMLIDPDTFET